jgi:hypothetical protein
VLPTRTTILNHSPDKRRAAPEDGPVRPRMVGACQGRPDRSHLGSLRMLVRPDAEVNGAELNRVVVRKSH